MGTLSVSGLLLQLRGQDLGSGGSSITSWANQAAGGGSATGVNTANLTVEVASTPLGGKAAAFASTGYFTFPVGAVSASSAAGSEVAANAVDHNASSYWTTNAVIAGWIRLDFGDSLQVKAYRIRRRDGALATRNPGAWTFEGSDDGTTWTTLDTQTGQTWPTASEHRTYTLSSAATYKKYRLNITANTGDASYTSLAEFSVVPSGVDMWVVTKSGATSSSRGLWRAGEDVNASDGALYPFTDGKVYEIAGTVVGNRQSFTPSVSIDSWRIYRVRNDGTTWQAWLDGTSQASASSLLPALPPTLLFGQSRGVNFNGGRIAEVLVFNHALDTTDAATVLAYLNAEHIAAPAAVTVTAPALALAADLRNPTVTVPDGVAVTAPALALAVDVRNPTVSAVTPQTVTAPALALTVDVLDPTVALTTPVNVDVPPLALAVDLLDPTISSVTAVAVDAPALALTVDALDPSVVAAEDETGAINLDVGVDLLILSQESQTPVVEDDGVVLLDATIDILVRHQLTPVAPPLGVLREWPVRRNAHLMPALSAAEPRRKGVPNFVGSDPYLYRTEHSDVGRLHTFVDGVDVTYLRDSPTRFDNVTSGVQVGPLSATLNVPQMRPWDEPGVGDLSMFAPLNDPRVEVVLVREDDTVDYLFEGALARDEDTSGQGREDYTFNAEGALIQAAHELFDPPIFQPPADPGWLIADVLNSVTHRRYGKIPRFDTGLPKVTDRGSQGSSKWQRAQDLLSKCIDDDGRMLELKRVGPWEFRLGWKRTVVTAQWTVTKGAPGVEVSLAKDQSTRRDAIYGRGVDPEGGVWGNYFFPGLDFYLPPRYPMNNSAINLDGLSDGDTDTGNGITTWQRRMVDLGYRVRVDGVMNSADVKYVKQIQRARGITVDGSLGPQTWSATFDKGATELNFDVVRRPLATTSAVEPWLFNANGARAGENPGDNPKRIRHAMPEVDFGSNIWKRDAQELARKWLARDNEAAHVGTVTLTSDPHEAGSSRFDIRPGDNVKVVGHRGDVVVQVAEVSFDDVTVTLTVDSKGRDVSALEAILDRDRDARRDPTGRRARTTDMSSLNKSEVVQYESESRAGSYPRTAINGGLWTVLPIFVSQVGVAKVEFTAKDPKAEMVIALFEKPITANRVASFVSNPLSSKEGWYDNIDELKESHGLMEIFGTPDSPGGYWPWQKGDHALTGRLVDTSGAVYSSKYGGYVWVAVFTSASTWVQGRVFPANGR